MTRALRPSTLPWWLLFLAAPLIWYAHFWAVYLVAEAACREQATGRGCRWRS